MNIDEDTTIIYCNVWTTGFNFWWTVPQFDNYSLDTGSPLCNSLHTACMGITVSGHIFHLPSRISTYTKLIPINLSDVELPYFLESLCWMVFGVPASAWYGASRNSLPRIGLVASSLYTLMAESRINNVWCITRFFCLLSKNVRICSLPYTHQLGSFFLWYSIYLYVEALFCHLVL
jgi:hypothetical protein